MATFIIIIKYISNHEHNNIIIIITIIVILMIISMTKTLLSGTGTSKQPPRCVRTAEPRSGFMWPFQFTVCSAILCKLSGFRFEFQDFMSILMLLQNPEDEHWIFEHTANRKGSEMVIQRTTTTWRTATRWSTSPTRSSRLGFLRTAGGMTRLEALIELKFINSSLSSSNFEIRAFRAYPLVEVRQTAPCRAIRGNGISVNSTLPPS